MISQNFLLCIIPWYLIISVKKVTADFIKNFTFQEVTHSSHVIANYQDTPPFLHPSGQKKWKSRTWEISVFPNFLCFLTVNPLMKSLILFYIHCKCAQSVLWDRVIQPWIIGGLSILNKIQPDLIKVKAFMSLSQSMNKVCMLQ